jgi:hypothetical protein
VGPTCHAIPPRGSSPKLPNSQAASQQLQATSRARLAAVPAGAASEFPSAPPLAPLGASQGPEQQTYSSRAPPPHPSPAAPWGLPISWISGQPARALMSGGQEDPEGSGDFD